VRPLDRRLLATARAARTVLVADAGLGVAAAVAVLAQAVLLSGVVAQAVAGEAPAALVGSVVALAMVVAARSALSAGFEATGRWAGTRVMSQLRRELVRHRLREVPRADDGVAAGELATAAVQGVDLLETYFARYLPQLVLACAVPGLVLVVAAVVDPLSAAIMLVTLPLIPVFMALIGSTTAARTRARWRAMARLSDHFLDVVRGLPTLRAFNRGAAQADRIAATGEAYRATTMQVLRVSFLSGAVLDLAATLGTALVAVSLGLRLVDGDVALRPALLVLLLTPELYAPLRALGAQYHASADGVAAAERILDLLDEPPAVAGGHAEPPHDWEVVRLESVGVTYPGRVVPALDGLDLELRRGEVVALVGPTGAGKSTVAALLLGFVAPGSGAVTVDGVDLGSLDLAAWRRQVSWLPQRPTLPRGTVRNAIAMGRPDASDEQVRAAAAAAQVDGTVLELRHGYATEVGDGARGLSLGEARRVALARALLRQAPLLVLDEPAAHLDPETADALALTIREAARDRAVLLVEHRPELVAIADRVVRLQAGAAAGVVAGATAAADAAVASGGAP
jgi:ATP-binding cassette, subfamily C, bacterial CydD